MIATPTLKHCTSSDWEKVYEPSEDSFLLIDALEQDLKLIKERQPCLCLEVGSGSGIVITALASALGSTARCFATDINPAACRLTSRTSVANSTFVELVQADLAPFKWGCLDLVLFNPPYVPTPSNEVYGEGIVRSWAGGIDGREVIDRFLPAIVPILAKNGLGYLLLLEQNKPTQVGEILSGLGCRTEIIASRRLRGESLVVMRFQKV